MTQTIPLREYPVSGRLTRNNDSRKEAAEPTPTSLPLTVAALPNDDHYELRLKVGSGQNETTYAYFNRQKLKKRLIRVQTEGKCRTTTSGMWFAFPTPTAMNAETSSTTIQILFELISVGTDTDPGLELSFAVGRHAGAEIELTPAQYSDLKGTFITLCRSSLPVEQFDDPIYPGIVDEGGTLKAFTP